MVAVSLGVLIIHRYKTSGGDGTSRCSVYCIDPLVSDCSGLAGH